MTTTDTPDVRWWDGPLATLDTETTGTDVENDRIVTAVLDVYDVAGRSASMPLMLDPGIEIPEAATLIHGITTEQAREEGMPPVTALSRLAGGLASVWAEGIPVVVYNAAFDVTLIDREMRRHLGNGLTIAGPIIDPMVIDRHVDRYVKGSGQRQLAPTCLRYGVELDNAHNAEADAYAAQALARAMGRKHDDKMPSSLADLYRWQQGLRRDQSTDLQAYFARIGNTNDDGSPIVINGDWPMQQWVEPVDTH
jgi:DNA polymerase-3 subunit epsilon